jgi:catechol 2,3-dioxygenase-like lactoylglutathione lyase family enzyme
MDHNAPPWQGLHHLALVTPDLDSTIQFYRDVLGMQHLFSAPAGEMHGRHAGFLLGEGASCFLHFFEMPNAQIFAPPDLNTMYWLPGALHHISIALPDEAAALAFRERLSHLNIALTPNMDQGDIYNFLFLDNHGILLEVAWPKGENL